MKYVVEDILVMKHGKNKKNSVNELPKKKRTYLLYLNEARFFWGKDTRRGVGVKPTQIVGALQL